MTGMLEKMARAIAVAQVEKIGGAIENPDDPGDMECALILARAALQAIREPDEAVADEIAYGVRVDDRCDPREGTGADAWRSAVDHILNEGEGK